MAYKVSIVFCKLYLALIQYHYRFHTIAFCIQRTHIFTVCYFNSVYLTSFATTDVNTHTIQLPTKRYGHRENGAVNYIKTRSGVIMKAVTMDELQWRSLKWFERATVQ